MAATSGTHSSQMEVVPASVEQEPVLANLLELYMHDFSEFHSLELDADGRFGYKNLAAYWNEPDRHPFLILVDGRLAGLALVQKVFQVPGRVPVWDMAEFFIVRAYRRSGNGLKAAHAVWRRFPGSWQVRVMDANRAALIFWQRAVSAFCAEEIHPVSFANDGVMWWVFEFESPLAAD